ncbi:endonuclease [Niallia oryzisoli]|uniref:Endonuclease n=1 Tax=Niallia oryzisoli TaxID=1737571 RepID=A0ABZ2CFK0_9BACI
MNSVEEKDFLSYICGKLLGDGCITLQPRRKPRFQFIHTASDYDWCNFCYKKLQPFLPLSPPSYRKVQDIRTLKGYTERYMVQSKTANIITYLESIWYSSRKKIIPFDFLKSYFNEKALAWWYLDDGHLKVDNGTPRKIILSTDNFTKLENQQLIKLLVKRFSLCFSLDGQNRLVIYDQPQIYYFYRLVEPFIHPSMHRKMIQFDELQNKSFPKRTTIYLPNNFTISKPTFTINDNLEYLPKLYEIVNDRNHYIDYYKNYFIKVLDLKDMKPYQVNVDLKHWQIIDNIKKFTGMNNSQITSLCFILQSYKEI